MSLDDDLAAYRARRRLYEELDDLDIQGSIRDEMIEEPAAALGVIDQARRAPRIKNFAAFVVSRWRRRARPPEPGPEPELRPPRLRDLDQIWSLADRDLAHLIGESWGSAAISYYRGALGDQAASLATLKPQAVQSTLDGAA